MTDLAAQKDQFRATLSGQLARIEQHLDDVIDAILTWNREVPHTVLEGDRTTLDQARIAVRTIRKGIDKQRGVQER